MKKIPIFLLFFLIVFSIPVFAFENYQNITGYKYNVTYLYPSDNKIYLVGSPNPIQVDNNIYLFTNGSKVYQKDSTGWIIQSSDTREKLHKFSNISNLITSDHDLKIVYTEDVFFLQLRNLTALVKKIPVLDQILIPIRGILPFLIPLVVLLVAFWKAWQFLLQQLRTA